MFICNSWELMLKAHMIDIWGESSLYYNDHPDRTLALSDCIKKVFTNDKDPLRMNLEKINELRNTSTHFITEEYEMVYVPLFQSCVMNYTEKMMDFHSIDMTELVPQNFLTLSVSLKSLNETEISAKYPEVIANKLLSLKNSIDDIASYNNAKFAININVNHFLTKDPKKADMTFRVAHDGEDPIALIKEMRDPNNIYNYTTKNAISAIKERLKRKHILLKYNGNDATFNSFHFNNFVTHFNIKMNSKFCWINKITSNPMYSYSQQAVDFIFNELSKDPDHILDNIKVKK